MSSLRAALEDAIAANPDDRAAHSAYADLLTEEGDPRGEFIAVQLALEDESLPPAEQYCAMMDGRWVERGWGRRDVRNGATA